MESARNDDVVGQVLLHYQVTERLGAGGMGVVYRAIDLKLKRTVALKFLPTAQTISKEDRQRFMREAMASSAVDHTNIGTLYTVEETDDGRLFLVMACYEGPALTEKMAKGPMPVDEAAGIAVQILRGLAEAHKQGIVHRDIKPGNLIFNSQGLLKILDFGLAKLHGSPELTVPGSTLGTAAYMSPEQATGDPVDDRSDLWSVGVVLYEMLSGRGPFQGTDLRSTIYAVISKEPETISGLSSPLEQILKKALQKDPVQRYQTAMEMIADLNAVRGGASEHPSASEIGTAPTVRFTTQAKTPSRRRWLIPSAAAVLLAISVFGIWMHTRRAAAASSGTRVAVLPLDASAEDTSSSNQLQALADGLRSRLILSLVNLEPANRGLLVIPSAQITAQHVIDPSTARRSLGAGLALTGSVTASGDWLHVVLSSIDTASAKVLKSEVVDGTITNLPALEEKMVKTSAKMLGLRQASSVTRDDLLSGLAPADARIYLASLGYLERWDKPGNLDAAIQGFGHVISGSPKFAPGYAAIADCYLRRYAATKDTHALEMADQNASHAALIDGQSPDVVLALGGVRVLQGRYQEAVSEFERALALDPRSDGAYRGLAQVYSVMGLPDKAEEAWRQTIALHPNSVDAYNQLARFQMGRADYDGAAKNFRKALNLAPDNATLMSNLGAALLYAGSLEDSRRMLQASIRLAPSYPAYTNLGNLDLKQGRFADAANDYEKALEFNKTDYRVWSNLAVAYSRTPGQQDKAKDGFLHAAQMCREALKESPNDPVVLSDLAMFVASEGDERQEPLVLIERALALAPEDTYVQFNAAETYEALGYRKDALDWVAKLIAAGYPIDDINDSPVLTDLVKDTRYEKLVQGAKRESHAQK